MAKFRLDYVCSFIDSRGKLRHVFRRKGQKRVTIKGRPGSPEFMDRYHALLDQTGGPLSDIGASRTKLGTIDALIVTYLQHDTFTKGLAKATQATRRPILDHFREFKTPSGRRYGQNRLGHDAEAEHHRRARRQDADHAEGLDEGTPPPGSRSPAQSRRPRSSEFASRPTRLSGSRPANAPKSERSSDLGR